MANVPKSVAPPLSTVPTVKRVSMGSAVPQLDKNSLDPVEDFQPFHLVLLEEFVGNSHAQLPIIVVNVRSEELPDCVPIIMEYCPAQLDIRAPPMVTVVPRVPTDGHHSVHASMDSAPVVTVVKPEISVVNSFLSSKITNCSR